MILAIIKIYIIFIFITLGSKGYSDDGLYSSLKPENTTGKVYITPSLSPYFQSSDLIGQNLISFGISSLQGKKTDQIENISNLNFSSKTHTEFLLSHSLNQNVNLGIKIKKSDEIYSYENLTRDFSLTQRELDKAILAGFTWKQLSLGMDIHLVNIEKNNELKTKDSLDYKYISPNLNLKIESIDLRLKYKPRVSISSPKLGKSIAYQPLQWNVSLFFRKPFGVLGLDYHQADYGKDHKDLDSQNIITAGYEMLHPIGIYGISLQHRGNNYKKDSGFSSSSIETISLIGFSNMTLSEQNKLIGGIRLDIQSSLGKRIKGTTKSTVSTGEITLEISKKF